MPQYPYSYWLKPTWLKPSQPTKRLTFLQEYQTSGLTLILHENRLKYVILSSYQIFLFKAYFQNFGGFMTQRIMLVHIRAPKVDEHRDFSHWIRIFQICTLLILKGRVSSKKNSPLIKQTTPIKESCLDNSLLTGPTN